MATPRPREPLTGTLLALVAAALFGATTPLVKHFGEGLGAFATAALLYGGAFLVSVPRIRAPAAHLRRVHIARVVGAAVLGACIAPALFAWGIARVSGSVGSLLLTSETVATVLLARLFLGEQLGGRIVLAIALIVTGTAILAGAGGGANVSGAIAIVLATIAWAFDNVITRPLADVDSVGVIRWKSAVGATLSTIIALAWERGSRPSLASVIVLAAAGAFGYGLSLRAYLAAQTRVGAARTGSVFAVAPFVAALASAVAAMQWPALALYLAAVPIALGVILHATERHAHLHRHEAEAHEHLHRHDDGHHDHVHDPPVLGEHRHAHRHAAIEHEHEHAGDPDAHH
ncbi:DMT family transporter [soil metagenome]